MRVSVIAEGGGWAVMMMIVFARKKDGLVGVALALAVWIG